MENTGNDRAYPAFLCRSARSSVMLHEEHLRGFLATWRRARAAGTRLPRVEDPDYASLDALLHHVFRWARTYLVWTCAQADLPEPAVDPLPEAEALAQAADDYLDHLLDAWRGPLAGVPAERILQGTHLAPWNVPYSIDAMLEHAVVHPMKHGFQLAELMGER